MRKKNTVSEAKENTKDKNNKVGYYFRRYLRENGVIFLCELLIIFLVGAICSILIEGRLIWLIPGAGAVAYIISELRFMKDYVARRVEDDAERRKQMENALEEERRRRAEAEAREFHPDGGNAEDGELDDELMARIRELLDTADANLNAVYPEDEKEPIFMDTLEQITYPPRPIFRKQEPAEPPKPTEPEVAAEEPQESAESQEPSMPELPAIVWEEEQPATFDGDSDDAGTEKAENAEPETPTEPEEPTEVQDAVADTVRQTEEEETESPALASEEEQAEKPEKEPEEEPEKEPEKESEEKPEEEPEKEPEKEPEEEMSAPIEISLEDIVGE